jgi:hypothetical protein
MDGTAGGRAALTIARERQHADVTLCDSGYGNPADIALNASPMMAKW